MAVNIKKLYRRIKLDLKHQQGYQAGKEAKFEQDEESKAEHYKQAFLAGKTAAQAGVPLPLSHDILMQKEHDFIHEDDIQDQADEAETEVLDETAEMEAIEEDEADEDTADNDDADIDMADFDSADIDEADFDEADDYE